MANEIFGREIRNRKWPLTGKGHTVDSVYQSCNTVISDITSLISCAYIRCCLLHWPNLNS